MQWAIYASANLPHNQLLSAYKVATHCPHTVCCPRFSIFVTSWRISFAQVLMFVAESLLTSPCSTLPHREVRCSFHFPEIWSRVQLKIWLLLISPFLNPAIISFGIVKYPSAFCIGIPPIWWRGANRQKSSEKLNCPKRIWHSSISIEVVNPNRSQSELWWTECQGVGSFERILNEIALFLLLHQSDLLDLTNSIAIHAIDIDIKTPLGWQILRAGRLRNRTRRRV